MITSLRSADLSLVRLDMEWFGEFTLLFLSEVDPINCTCKCLASKWGKFKQRSWIHSCLRVR